MNDRQYKVQNQKKKILTPKPTSLEIPYPFHLIYPLSLVTKHPFHHQATYPLHHHSASALPHHHQAMCLRHHHCTSAHPHHHQDMYPPITTITVVSIYYIYFKKEKRFDKMHTKTILSIFINGICSSKKSRNAERVEHPVDAF